MGTTFSIVYPTRHRPEFIGQALRILETQRYADFEVVISDNFTDPAFSCESLCRESTVANVRYVRPRSPLGMVENWNHALPFATGDYVCFLTDKMFVLPDALSRIERAIEEAGRPDIVSWTSDFYFPTAYPDYFGGGGYANVTSDVRWDSWRRYSPATELDLRGQANISRLEQSSADYCRGKLVFGAYQRGLVEEIVQRYGALFHTINPDYTSMVLGLSQAGKAIEIGRSCVVSINTDISNGWLSDTNDAAALAFLNTLGGGAESVLPTLLVPGLYASLHNWVAHDYLTLKKDFGLPFRFAPANWLVYCTEDIHRPGRQWSDPRVEAEQKGILRAFMESAEPSLAATVASRLAARARPRRRPHARRILKRLMPRPAHPGANQFPSIQAAVAYAVAVRD